MILSGFNYLEPNYPYTWLIKTNESGDTTWTRNFHEQYNYIQQTTDNGYIMIGFKDNEDLYIVKLNVRGENQWIKIMNDYRGIYDCRGLYIGQTSDHGYLGVAKTDNEYTTLIRLGKDPLLAVKENNLLPLYYKMSQNYPNPFNPSTTIKFDLPKTSDVRLEVYNLAGQIVQTIINKKIPAGSHQVEFNAHNLSSGVYYYRIHVGEFQDVKKMILLR
jgi:hypothetical protein